MNDKHFCGSCPACGKKPENANLGLCRLSPPTSGNGGFATWPSVDMRRDWCTKHPKIVEEMFGNQCPVGSPSSPADKQYMAADLKKMSESDLYGLARVLCVETVGKKRPEIEADILDVAGKEE